MSPDLAKGQRVSIANIALAGLTYRLVILPDTPASCGDSGPARGAARQMGWPRLPERRGQTQLQIQFKN